MLYLCVSILHNYYDIKTVENLCLNLVEVRKDRIIKFIILQYLMLFFTLKYFDKETRNYTFTRCKQFVRESGELEQKFKEIPPIAGLPPYITIFTRFHYFRLCVYFY